MKYQETVTRKGLTLDRYKLDPEEIPALQALFFNRSVGCDVCYFRNGTTDCYGWECGSSDDPSIYLEPQEKENGIGGSG
jgi:hypothetical protein